MIFVFAIKVNDYWYEWEIAFSIVHGNCYHILKSLMLKPLLLIFTYIFHI